MKNYVRKNNYIKIYLWLIIAYYIINLLTSETISGMSGEIQAENNIYNQLTIGIILLYTLVFSFIPKSQSLPLFYKTTLVFISYLLLREFFVYYKSPLFVREHLNTYLSIIYWISSLTFCIYYINRAEDEQVRKIIRLLVIVYLVFIFYRVTTQKIILNQAGIIAGVNVAGSVYMIIPLIFLTFGKKTRILLFFICAYLCIISAKRQAIIGLGIVTFLLIPVFYKTIFKKNTVQGVVFALMIVIMSLIFRNNIINSFDDINERQTYIVENRGDIDSGRSELRKAALVGYSSANMKTKFFGSGAGTGLFYITNLLNEYRAPHNGFIEVLCDYGIVGVSLYSLFFILLLLYTFKLKSSYNRYVWLAICASWIFINLVSHAGNLNCVFLSIGIAYILRLHQYEKN